MARRPRRTCVTAALVAAVATGAVGALLALRCAVGLSGPRRSPGRGGGRTSLAALRTQSVTDRSTALRLLGLEGSSPSDKDIKRAFRSQVLLLHPDKEGGSVDKFRMVVDAYELLTDRGDTAASGMTRPARPGGARWRGRNFNWEEYLERERAKEAKYKQDGQWRWSQETGYNPEDLDDVWTDIGYNPYTGEYKPPREAVAHQDAPTPSYASASASSASDQAGRAAWQAARQQAAEEGSLERRIPGSLLLQILGWCVVVLLCAMRGDLLMKEAALREEVRSSAAEYGMVRAVNPRRVQFVEVPEVAVGPEAASPQHW